MGEIMSEKTLTAKELTGKLATVKVNTVKSKWTDFVLGQFGAYQFQVEGTRLPCLSANLKIQDFVSLIEIHEGVPAQEDREWKINEIFQREINYDRVNNDISYYLKSNNKTVYLPGITVVMHPLEPGKERRILEEFSDSGDTEELPEAPSDEFLNTLYAIGTQTDEGKHHFVDGLEISSAWEDLSLLRWDTSKVMAIAIDGQHRLKSISKLIEDYKSNPPHEVNDTRIPVNFVLPIPSFGYSGGKTPRDVSRDIFSDVNQNPVTPSASRMVLLKDSDIVSLCTRKLVSEKIPAEFRDSRIPLQMIRWKEDKIPFVHPDWEFNSIMNLKKIVSSVLNLKGIKNPYDPESVKEYLEYLGEAMSSENFSIDTDAGSQTLLEFYNDNFTEVEDDERKAVRPFVENQIESVFLEKIVEKFVEKHSSYIIPVLTELLPYSDYLDYCTENNLFTGTFGGFNSQPRSHQEQISEPKNWRKTNIEPHELALKNMKKDKNGVNLSWYVIFQEALIMNAKTIQFSQAGEHELLGGIDDYIENMNLISDYFWSDSKLDGVEKYLWTYICTRPDNNNPATKSANKNRIQALIMLWHQVMQKDKRKQSEGKDVDSIDNLFSLFQTDDLTADYPDAKKHIETLVNGYKNYQEFYDLDDEDAIIKANTRIKKLLQLPRFCAEEAKKAAEEEAKKAADEEANSSTDTSFEF
jgi:DGQHR domain-containing protein